MIEKSSTIRGFTLLEMLVSLGIFSVVAVIAVGALVRITGLNRQAQTLQSSMNNIGYALETMSRDMRMRSQYTCVDDIGGIAWTGNAAGETNLEKRLCVVPPLTPDTRIVAYESAERGSDNKCNLIYAFGFFKIPGSNPAKWSLKKYQQTHCGDSPSSSDFYPIIDETNTVISNYQLGVYGAHGYADPQGNAWGQSGQYSLVFIRLSGYAGTREKEKNYFDVQTSVSERIGEK